MTKAEFTPVANALESNIDAALARIRELEARLAEREAEIGKLGASLSRAALRAIDAEKERDELKARLDDANREIVELESQLCTEQTERTREVLRHGVTQARAEKAEVGLKDARQSWQLAVEREVQCEARLAEAEGGAVIERYQNQIQELEAQVQNARLLNDEMNGRLGDLLEAYEEVVVGNQVLLQRAEKAKARAEALRELAQKLLHWLERSACYGPADALREAADKLQAALAEQPAE